VRIAPTTCLAALLAGCGPTVTFSIDARSASVTADKTDQAIEYALPDDFRTTVEGPHAVGSLVPVMAARPLGPVDLWTVDVGPSEQAALERRFDAGNEMRLAVEILAEGTSEIEVFDPAGNSEGVLEMEARPVAGAALFAFDDIVVGPDEPLAVAPDGVIRVVEGLEATLVVVWLDAEGVPLTGSGILSIEGVDTLNTLRLQAVRTTDVPGLDSFQIRGERPTGDQPPATLTVLANGAPMGTWQVEVLDGTALSSVTLVEKKEYGLGGRVGFVQAVAQDAAGNRIVGPELGWTNNSEPLLGTGSYVALVDGCDSFVEACSPSNGLCVGTNVHAEARLVGKGVARPPIECSHGGAPPALGSALLALAALFARRRRWAATTALGALLALAPTASAQAPQPAPAPVPMRDRIQPPLAAPAPAPTAPEPAATAPEPAPTGPVPAAEPAPAEPAPEAEAPAPPAPAPAPDAPPTVEDVYFPPSDVIQEVVEPPLVLEPEPDAAPVPEPTEEWSSPLISDFMVRPTIAWGIHTPINSLTPVRSNFVLGLTARYGFQRDIGRKGILLAGTGHLGMTGMFGNVRSGWEIRGTGIIGPQFTRGRRDYKVSFTPLTGVELIVDRYRYYCRSFGTAFMLSIPMMARVRLAVFTLEGGVAPSWFLSARVREPVQWKVQDIKGFGDEFEFRAGASVQLDNVNLGFNVRTRVASYGDESWLALGMAYSTFF